MEEGCGHLPRAAAAATILGVAVVGAGWVGLEVQVGLREAEIERLLEERDEWRKAVQEVEALEVLERELREVERIAHLRSDPAGPVRAAAEVGGARPGSLRIDALDLGERTIVVRGWTAGLETLADWLEQLNRSELFSEPELRQLKSRPEFLRAPSVRSGHGFTVLLTSVSAEPSESDFVLAEGSSELDRGSEPRSDPPPSLIPPFFSSTRLIHVPVKDLEVLGIYFASSGPVAQARSRGAVSWIRAGDLLQDGEVAWIGFFSESLAAVRLERRVWPPDGGRPYREELRVLGWDSLGEARPPARERPEGVLRVAGREALGSWPDGRYSNPRETLVDPGGGGPLPAVDLFAAVFHELYGLFPWQHESWSQEGWTVETGFPWHGTILGMEREDDEGARRDPFHSLLEPWKVLRPFRRPGWRPGGLAGLLIDEIELTEVYASAGLGPVAEARSYGSFQRWTLRPGDQLWDGHVVSISPFVRASGSPEACGEVVLQQVVEDPMALKPFREVVKRPRRRRPWPCPRGPAEGQSRDLEGRRPPG